MANGDIESRIKAEAKGSSITTLVVGAYLIILTLNFISFLFSNVGQPLARFIVELSNFAAAWAFPSLIIYAAWKIHEEGFYGPLAAFGVTALMLLFFPVLRVSNISFIGGLGVARIPGVGISLQPLINLVLSVAAIFGVFAVLKYLGKQVGIGGGERVSAAPGAAPTPPTGPAAGPQGGLPQVREDVVNAIGRLFRRREGRENIDKVLSAISKTLSIHREEEIQALFRPRTGFVSRILPSLNVMLPILQPPALFGPPGPTATPVGPVERAQFENELINLARSVRAIRDLMKRESSAFSRLLVNLERLSREEVFLQLNPQRVSELRPMQVEVLELVSRARQREVNIVFLSEFYKDLSGIFARLLRDPGGGGPIVSRRFTGGDDYLVYIRDVSEQYHVTFLTLIASMQEIVRLLRPRMGLVTSLAQSVDRTRNNVVAVAAGAGNRRAEIINIINNELDKILDEIVETRRFIRNLPVNAAGLHTLTQTERNTINSHLNRIDAHFNNLRQLLLNVVLENEPWLVNFENDPFLGDLVRVYIAGIRGLRNNITAGLDRLGGEAAGVKLFRGTIEDGLTAPGTARGAAPAYPDFNPADLDRSLDPPTLSITNIINGLRNALGVAIRDIYESIIREFGNYRIDDIAEFRTLLLDLWQILSEQLVTRPRGTGP